jgi:hypothetical protein
MLSKKVIMQLVMLNLFNKPYAVYQDKIIEEGSPYVIFSWSDQDPEPGQDISYHGVHNRGTKSINLISNVKREVPNNLEELHFPIQNVNKNNFLILLYKSKLRKLKKNLFRF